MKLILFNLLFATAVAQYSWSTPDTTASEVIPNDVATLQQQQQELAEGELDCSFQGRLTILDDLFLEQIVNPVEGTATFRLTYEGEGWVGLGISPTGFMLQDNLAIIGLPDDNTVLKYNLGGKNVAGVQPRDASQQTLSNVSIEQADGRTILTFTKLLSEPGEVDLDATGSNTFIYATGFANNLAFHQQYGAFATALTACRQAGDDSPPPVVDQVVETFNDELGNQPKYRAHGICMAGAWAVLIPIAIGSSLIRSYLPDGLWFLLHRGFNALGLLLTLIGFALIVYAIDDNNPESPEHFQRNTHRKAGLAVVILAMLQATNGLLRPHAPHNKTVNSSTTPKQEEDDVDAAETGHEEEDSDTPAADDKCEKTKARFGWEILHRSMGLATLGLAWYNCHSGIARYSTLVGEGDQQTMEIVLWIFAIGLLAPMAALGVYSRIKACENNKK